MEFPGLEALKHSELLLGANDVKRLSGRIPCTEACTAKVPAVGSRGYTEDRNIEVIKEACSLVF